MQRGGWRGGGGRDLLPSKLCEASQAESSGAKFASAPNLACGGTTSSGSKRQRQAAGSSKQEKEQEEEEQQQQQEQEQEQQQ